MERPLARFVVVTLAWAMLVALGGCQHEPPWNPETPQEVEAYADEFQGFEYYP